MLFIRCPRHIKARIGHLEIVAHGGPGQIDLGKGDDLSLATLPEQAKALQGLRDVLTSDAELDLLACSVAAGANGKAFVDKLSALTGAAVFASDNPVGTVPGADFVWEYHSGQPAAGSDLFSVQELETIPNVSLSLPDLVISSISVSPSSGNAGSSASVSVTVRNQGTGTAAASTTHIRLAASTTITTSDPLLDTFTAGRFRPGSRRPTRGR